MVRGAPARPLFPGVTGVALLDGRHGCNGLHQRRLTVDAGASFAASGAGLGESWYVVDGAGTLLAGDRAVELRPGVAVWLKRGTDYRCSASAELALLAVTVRSGAPERDTGSAIRATALDECPPERTGDREFRVLLTPGPEGDLAITQFAGVIPPGRAPAHQHSYDEVVHVLAGRGVVHLGGGSTPIEPGTSVYLPPLQPHCLQNDGAEPLRVLGVFYPAGSPAAKRASG